MSISRTGRLDECSSTIAARCNSVCTSDERLSSGDAITSLALFILANLGL